jgi:cytochrome b
MAIQRKPVVDLGTRMAHASMALAFFISYVTSESEYWRLVHVYSGYSLAAVLAFRMVWGWVGPASARWALLLRRVAMWRVWFNKFKQGEWLTRNFWVGASSWVLSAAVLCIYAFCTVAIASGWATYNELLGDGWLNDALQELHEGFGCGVYPCGVGGDAARVARPTSPATDVARLCEYFWPRMMSCWAAACARG